MSAAPGHAGAQRRELALVVHRQQRVIQRRRAGQHRDPSRASISSTTRRCRTPAPAASSRPRISDAMQAGLVAEGVEVRVDHQIAVALAQIGQVAPLLVQPQRLPVVHHDALGPAGGARGVDDVGDVGAVDLRARTANRWPGSPTSGRSPARRRARRNPGPRKPCWTSTALAPLRADDVGGLLGLEPGVDRDQHAARGHAARTRR